MPTPSIVFTNRRSGSHEGGSCHLDRRYNRYDRYESEPRNFPLNCFSVWFLVWFISCVSLLGCKVGPNYQRPTAPKLQREYLTSGTENAQSIDDLGYWWSYFNDPVLNGLIASSCRQNLDLYEAYFRIMEARAQVLVVRGGLFPQVNSDDSYDYKRTSVNANQFVSAGNLGDGFDLYSVGFDSNWELDIFGRIRRSIESAVADLESHIEARRNVKVTMLADVASSYTNIRVLQKRIAIAENNLQLQRQTLEMVQHRLDAGLVRPLDKAQAESNVYTTAASIPVLRQDLQTEFNRLSILLGETPSEQLIRFVAAGEIPQSPQWMAAGVPGQLLWRRPDVRQREREVASASARIGVAVADKYPVFSLRGDVAFDTRQLATLFATDSLTYSIGPSVRWNLLNFGRVRGNIQVHQARYQQAVVRYRQAILLAVEEVENGLVAYEQERQRVGHLRQAVRATTRTVDLSRSEYGSGLISFQTVLDSQRQRLTTEEQLASSEGNVVLNLIRTYKALGGGWNSNCCVEVAAQNQTFDQQQQATPEELPEELPRSIESSEQLIRPARQHELQ